MAKQLPYLCIRCNAKISKPGLCSKCMTLHDLKFKIFVGCVTVLSLVCLYFYYIIYIDNKFGFLTL
jgi:hypothetical protein